MTVYGVSFDLVGKQPIVLLKTNDGNTFLPIWIGHSEAAAILMNLQGTEPPRPMTHDLATSIIASLDGEIRQVTVTELRDSTFHALITIVRNGAEIELDARTSDAIALALRSDAKIFAADEVIEESGVEFEGDEEEASRRLTGQESLADLDPDEFAASSTPSRRTSSPRSQSPKRIYRGEGRAPPVPLSAELPLRQVEQLRHQAVEALGRERTAVGSGKLFAQAPLAIGVDGVEPSSAFSFQSAVTRSRRWLTAATIASSLAVISAADLVERLARVEAPPGSERQRVEDSVHDHARVDATGLPAEPERG